MQTARIPKFRFISLLLCILIIFSLSTEAAPRSDAVFGQGSGPILLDLVRCNGLENALFDCGRGRGIEPYSCRHHQDAGVVCAEGEGFQALLY